MQISNTFFVFLIFFYSTWLSAFGEPIAGFQPTPQILKPSKTVQKKVSEIIDLRNQLEVDILTKKMKSKNRDSHNGNPSNYKILILDQNENVREYEVSCGSEDLAENFDYVYDEKSRLRMLSIIYETVARDKNWSEEQTIFLNEKGKVLEVIYKKKYREWDKVKKCWLDYRTINEKTLKALLVIHDVRINLKLNPQKDYELNVNF